MSEICALPTKKPGEYSRAVTLTERTTTTALPVEVPFSHSLWDIFACTYVSKANSEVSHRRISLRAFSECRLFGIFER